jgi:hypothetical protein
LFTALSLLSFFMISINESLAVCKTHRGTEKIITKVQYMEKEVLINDVFSEMAARWPSSVVARAEVKQFTGGGISPKTLANADSEGSGPTGRFFIGRRVCYTATSLVEWLRKNTKGADHAKIH